MANNLKVTEKALERLRSMTPSEVADVVKKAFKDAGIEPSEGPTEILFGGLFDNRTDPSGDEK